MMSKRDYIQANKDWLEAGSKEEGVKALPKEIYYKVLAEGDASSVQPTVRSIITAHYTGKTIDGKQFDRSRSGVPLACRLCDLIEGWIIAMQQMHIGDKWELYIPAEMGYGKFSQPGIPGGSRLHLRKTQINLVFRSVCSNFFVNEESTSVRKCSNKFGILLTYSYLCTKIRKYGKKKMALQGRATAHGAGQAHHVFGE